MFLFVQLTHEYMILISFGLNLIQNISLCFICFSILCRVETRDNILLGGYEGTESMSSTSAKNSSPSRNILQRPDTSSTHSQTTIYLSKALLLKSEEMKDEGSGGVVHHGEEAGVKEKVTPIITEAPRLVRDLAAFW